MDTVEDRFVGEVMVVIAFENAAVNVEDDGGEPKVVGALLLLLLLLEVVLPDSSNALSVCTSFLLMASNNGFILSFI